MGCVYLLHFNRPLGSKKHKAQHYIGFCDNLVLRMQHHRRGSSAAIMRAVKRKRIGWEVVRVWENADRSFERRMKNAGHYARHCPTCRALQLAPAPERIVQPVPVIDDGINLPF